MDEFGKIFVPGNKVKMTLHDDIPMGAQPMLDLARSKHIDGDFDNNRIGEYGNPAYHGAGQKVGNCGGECFSGAGHRYHSDLLYIK